MQGIKDLYSKRAGQYDLTANLYYLIGIRINAYRRDAVRALNLRRGSTVLELGCGTGLNFPFLEEVIGEEGQIIGLDLTPAMLHIARKRIHRHGWNNVELIEADVSQFELPKGVDGVFTTFALAFMPAYQEVIRKSAQALNGGGRLVILDTKLITGPLEFLNPLGVWITKPYGGSYEAYRRKPWEEMQKHLTDVQVREYYAGFIYIASGSKENE
ncbi:MAG: class I SAM-dependent methyltransferase [Anaerolineae bacterium]